MLLFLTELCRLVQAWHLPEPCPNHSIQSQAVILSIMDGIHVLVVIVYKIPVYHTLVCM